MSLFGEVGEWPEWGWPNLSALQESDGKAAFLVPAGFCMQGSVALARGKEARECAECVLVDCSPIAWWSARRAGMHHSVISNKNLLFSAKHWEIDGECCCHSSANTIKEWSKQMVGTRAGTWLIAALVLQEKCGAEMFTRQHGRSVPHRGWDHWWRVRHILHWTSVVKLDLTSHQSLKFPSTLLSVHLKHV